jgi:hypothetical protein
MREGVGGIVRRSQRQGKRATGMDEASHSWLSTLQVFREELENNLGSLR